jgi:hypothetical protein
MATPSRPDPRQVIMSQDGLDPVEETAETGTAILVMYSQSLIKQTVAR